MLQVTFIVFALLATGYCWPSGAPESTCNTLLPSHGSNRPKPASSSPFTLTQSHDDFEPGERVRVIVKAPDGLAFKGLVVQAYDPLTNLPIGSFQSGRGLKTLDACSAVTHTDKRGKRSATLIWIAPPNARGKVAFRATIVQRFSEFYYGINAEIESKA
ncbi:putative defense protein 3-like protein [Dinothrombium tinctorium]|uniref:Putative defense protein 3-like protein n=1 Tax=Dinothrombium tinctorium TaxID=1965070 RepID=A0A443RAV8_9ACAR|nr:putative defense protein 3-like protein [Dinothrombium tinctorium]